MTVAACELVLEALVARKKISRSDGGQYGRANRSRAGGRTRICSAVACRDEHRARGAAPRDSTISTPSSSCGSRCSASTATIRSTGGCAPTRTSARAICFERSSLSPDETMLLAERGGVDRGHAALRGVAGVAAALSRALLLRVVGLRASRRAPAGRAARAARRGRGWCDERGLTEMRLHNATTSADARERVGRARLRGRRTGASPCAPAQPSVDADRRTRTPTSADAGHHDLADVRLRRIGGRRARGANARLGAVRQRRWSTRSPSARD